MILALPRPLLAALLIPCAALAQGGCAELFGTVRDASGLPLPGVAIQAVEEATGAVSNAVTADAGRYDLLALSPGLYTVSASKAGWTTLRRSGVRLRTADRAALDLQLEVAGLTQTVEVKAAPGLLKTAAAGESFVATGEKIGTLPLDGRNFVPLVALSSGVSLPPGSSASPSVLPRINGSRPRTNEYLYDGISVLQPEPGQVAYFPVLDAVAEFRVQLNSYSAEYGRSNGGVIQVTTRAGTNELHGTLFEYLRNDALNARNLFAAGGSKPPFKRNQYGFVLGGPIRKNRTFFLVDWQGTRLRIGNTRISTVPTSLERNGIFARPVYDPDSTRQTGAGFTRDVFAGNRIPRDRFDPAAAALLSRYPAPNVFLKGREAVSNNYRRVAIDSTRQDQADARLDRYFGERQRLFARYTWFRDASAPGTPLPDGSGAISSGVIGDTRTRADSVVAEHSYTISPASVNQFRFGYTRRGFRRAGLLAGAPASAVTGIPNIPSTAFADSLPVFQVAGYQQLGPPENANSRFSTSVTQLVDTFSTIRSRHSIKAGTDIRYERLDVLQPPDPTGLFTFNNIATAGLSAAGTPVTGTGSGLASFLLGQVNSFNIDLQQDTLKPRAKSAEFYVQDDVRLTSRLSLGLGVRYTLNFPSVEADDRGGIFNLDTQTLDFPGRDGVPRSARRLHYGDFGPRVSLAFRATDSVAVRAGYGLVWIEQAGITTPFTLPYFPFIQSAGQRSQDNVHPAFILSGGPSVEIEAPNPDSGLGQGVFAVDRSTGSGYAQQWNFTIQKTIGTHWSLETGYRGSKLTGLGVPDTNLNQLPAAYLAMGPALTAQVPNPWFGEIPASSSIGGPAVARQQLLRPFPRFTSVSLFRNNMGNSTYHALQAQLERRFAQGLTLTAAYTFSKLIDDASSVFDAAILTGPVANFPVADSFNRALEKDVSTGDIPHVFAASCLYELPFGRGRRFALQGWRNAVAGGWELAGVIRTQSGMPLAVTQLTNFNAFAGYGTQRPDRIAGPNLPGGERSTGRWFDTAAFVAAPQFAIGNSSRNPVRGPGYQAADMMLAKVFNVSERVNLEFRAEAFNISNTPPLGQPNGVLGNAAFGSITTALDPRVFELALKLSF